MQPLKLPNRNSMGKGNSFYYLWHYGYFSYYTHKMFYQSGKESFYNAIHTHVNHLSYYYLLLPWITQLLFQLHHDDAVISTSPVGIYLTYNVLCLHWISALLGEWLHIGRVLPWTLVWPIKKKKKLWKAKKVSWILDTCYGLY